MRERNVAKGRPAVADVSFAFRIKQKHPSVTLVLESFVSQLNDGHEAFVQKRVVEPAVD